MKEIIELINAFETRNNISISIEIHCDGSGLIKDFWNGEVFAEFNSADSFETYLKETQYELHPSGRCKRPIKIVK